METFELLIDTIQILWVLWFMVRSFRTTGTDKIVSLLWVVIIMLMLHI